MRRQQKQQEIRQNTKTYYFVHKRTMFASHINNTLSTINFFIDKMVLNLNEKPKLLNRRDKSTKKKEHTNDAFSLLAFLSLFLLQRD